MPCRPWGNGGAGRWETVAGERTYYALVNYRGKQRVSRRRFPKASEATLYGHELAERMGKMLRGGYRG